MPSNNKPLVPPVSGLDDVVSTADKILLEKGPPHRRFTFSLEAQADTREHLKLLLQQVMDEVERTGLDGFIEQYSYGFRYHVIEDAEMDHVRYYDEMRVHGAPKEAA